MSQTINHMQTGWNSTLKHRDFFMHLQGKLPQLQFLLYCSTSTVVSIPGEWNIWFPHYFKPCGQGLHPFEASAATAASLRSCFLWLLGYIRDATADGRQNLHKPDVGTVFCVASFPGLPNFLLFSSWMENSIVNETKNGVGLGMRLCIMYILLFTSEYADHDMTASQSPT